MHVHVIYPVFNNNPSLATPGYIRFHADFQPNNMSLK